MGFSGPIQAKSLAEGNSCSPVRNGVRDASQHHIVLFSDRIGHSFSNNTITIDGYPYRRSLRHVTYPLSALSDDREATLFATLSLQIGTERWLNVHTLPGKILTERRKFDNDH